MNLQNLKCNQLLWAPLKGGVHAAAQIVVALNQSF